MYGTRDQFDYQQCNLCHSLQIVEIPDNLGRFYANDYYSMSKPLRDDPSIVGRLLALVKHQRDRRCLNRFSVFGGLIAKTHPPSPALRGFAAAEPLRDDNILDVGCGEAALFLRQLAGLGFTRLQGADPFISADIIMAGTVAVARRRLDELDGPFDIITLNHSFEHMPDPRAAFAQLHRLLSPNGTCVLRVPTPSSYAFEQYGADWVQIDAPRHLNLPSRQGVRLLAEAHNMKLVSSFDDSSAFQFMGSELIRRDIPFLGTDADGAFARDEIARYSAQAAALNSQQRGDQATFLIKRAG